MSIIKDITGKVKQDSFKTASLSLEVRNKALTTISEILVKNKEEIFLANEKDLKKAIKDDLASPILKRLKFNEEKLNDVISGFDSLLRLPDPLGKIMLKRSLDQDLELTQITCPIGVIGVIFESRPDALVQIASLCIKSGNCAILKGGSESMHTNKILFELIYKGGLQAGMPSHFLTLIENRAEITELLKCDEHIDLLIPRGSNEFVQFIMENSKIPVMGHADGVCHIYADNNADIEKAIPIIIDAKTQYVAACNTVETLLIHQDIAPTLLPSLITAIENNPISIEVRGCDLTKALLKADGTSTAPDFNKEYLDYIINVKIVKDMEEAIEHINTYGSHHTDCILTEDDSAAEKFMLLVDSAGVYQNCSTRFADGFRYGFGAEVGISTGKLHARGPVGLEGLVTYKYKLKGNGQIVDDYSKGIKKFDFKNL